MTITWRPLPSAVLMQQKIAAALGGKPMTLAPLWVDTAIWLSGLA